jgi:hypothetical protein
VRGHWGLLWAYDSPDVNPDSQNNYVLRRLAPAVRSGRNVLPTLSRSPSGIFAICCDLTRWSAWLGARFHRDGGPFVSGESGISWFRFHLAFPFEIASMREVGPHLLELGGWARLCEIGRITCLHLTGGWSVPGQAAT